MLLPKFLSQEINGSHFGTNSQNFNPNLRLSQSSQKLSQSTLICFITVFHEVLKTPIFLILLQPKQSYQYAMVKRFVLLAELTTKCSEQGAENLFIALLTHMHLISLVCNYFRFQYYLQAMHVEIEILHRANICHLFYPS